jgi:hypothetical protein
LLRTRNIPPAADENDRLCDRCFPQFIYNRLQPLRDDGDRTIRQISKRNRAELRRSHVCPHSSTSQGLEVLATDLMAKANELENLNMD